MAKGAHPLECKSPALVNLNSSTALTPLCMPLPARFTVSVASCTKGLIPSVLRLNVSNLRRALSGQHADCRGWGNHDEVDAVIICMPVDDLEHYGRWL